MTVRKWGTEQLVNTSTFNAQQHPSVAALGDGGFVVVWDDSSGQGGDASSSSIKMQRYDAFGNKAVATRQVTLVP